MKQRCVPKNWWREARFIKVLLHMRSTLCDKKVSNNNFVNIQLITTYTLSSKTFLQWKTINRSVKRDPRVNNGSQINEEECDSIIGNFATQILIKELLRNYLVIWLRGSWLLHFFVIHKIKIWKYNLSFNYLATWKTSKFPLQKKIVGYVDT